MRREGEERWLLKALPETADALASELYDLEPDWETWRPPDGDWTLREIVAHLHAAEELALAQLRHLAAGEPSSVPLWDVESPATASAVDETSLFSLLEAFLLARRQTSLLLRALRPGQWQKQGRHPYRGPITATHIARELAEHDLEHLWQIRRYKEARTSSSPGSHPP